MGVFGALLLMFFIWFVILPLGKIIWTIFKAQRRFRQAREQFAQAFGGGNGADGRSERKAGWSASPVQRRKHIDPSVGEYVKFEERELTVEERQQRDDQAATYTYTKYVDSRIEEAQWEEI